jgi:hypothetical protein
VKSLSIDGRPLAGNFVPVDQLRDGATLVAVLG